MKTLLEEKLLDFIETKQSIRCSSCSRVFSQRNIDDYSFAERIANEGWAIKKQLPICPECNKLTKNV